MYDFEMNGNREHEHGYGFNFSDFEAGCDAAGAPITAEDMDRLLAAAPKLRKEYVECLGHDLTIEDYRDYSALGLSDIFATAVCEAENLTRIVADNASDDFEDDQCVLFAQGIPWKLSERERNIQPDEIEAIFRKHLGILKPGVLESGVSIFRMEEF